MTKGKEKNGNLYIYYLFEVCGGPGADEHCRRRHQGGQQIREPEDKQPRLHSLVSFEGRKGRVMQSCVNPQGRGGV